jgi:transposase
MKAYSTDLRAKILDAVDAGMSKSEAARTFRVGLATVKRYAALRREQGTLDPKPHPGRPPPFARSSSRRISAPSWWRIRMPIWTSSASSGQLTAACA